MKPAWDKLIRQYTNSSSLLVGDVDCTSSGKSLCEAQGIRGYPTIKYGEVGDLEDYSGGREFADLSAFAATLAESCSASRAESCSEEDRALMAECQAMGAAKRKAMIDEKKAEAEKVEQDYTARMEALSKRYRDESTSKDEAIQALRADGSLSFLKTLRVLERRSAGQ